MISDIESASQVAGRYGTNTLVINDVIVQMVVDLGFKRDYVKKCIEKNELNQATTAYYLFANYENIK